MNNRKMLSALLLLMSFAFAGAYAQESGRKAVQQATKPAKIQVTVSQQVIDQQMKAYNGNLKEIVREAENNLKKIDKELERGK